MQNVFLFENMHKYNECPFFGTLEKKSSSCREKKLQNVKIRTIFFSISMSYLKITQIYYFKIEKKT